MSKDLLDTEFKQIMNNQEIFDQPINQLFQPVDPLISSIPEPIVPRNSSSTNLQEMNVQQPIIPFQQQIQQKNVQNQQIQQQNHQIAANVANFIQSLPAQQQNTPQFTQQPTKNTSPFILNADMQPEVQNQQVAADVANFIQSLPQKQSDEKNISKKFNR